MKRNETLIIFINFFSRITVERKVAFLFIIIGHKKSFYIVIDEIWRYKEKEKKMPSLIIPFLTKKKCMYLKKRSFIYIYK